MVSLSQENIKSEKFKVSLSVLGVSLSIFLILIMFGLTIGLGYVVELPIRKTEADLWVTNKDSFGSLHSPSLLPISNQANLLNVSGVESVQPLIRIPVTKKIDGTNYLLYIMGYNTSNGIGGPWKSSKPIQELQEKEIIMDIALAKNVGYQLGDKITIKDDTFTIAGFSEDSSMLIAFAVFMNFQDARQFLPENLTSFFVIQLKEGISLETVKSNILATKIGSSISVLESDTIAKQYRSELLDGFTPILTVLSFIGLFVSVLVISMTVYSLTLEKIKDYAILKSFGASNKYLYKIVLGQSILLSIFAIIFSSALIQPVVYILRELVPEFIVLVPIDLILMTSILSIITAVIASFIPIRKLMSIDPVLVFK